MYLDKEKSILSYLKTYHVGKANAVSSRQLEKEFNLYGTEVRSAINKLRLEGYPVCSGKNGYYLAANKEEIFATLSSLINRIHGINNAMQGLIKAIEKTY